MKKIFYTLLLVLAFHAAEAQILRVATYNIRYDNPHDTLDLWKNRAPYLTDLIRLYDFDIFGTQEGLKNQLDDIIRLTGVYAYIGVGRDDGSEKGEYTAVFYKKDLFDLISEGHFWLSEITDMPNKGWDAAFPRICTWGKFREKKSGRTFYLFNNHFDHLGEQARTESSKLVLSKIREIAGNEPVILTGDFNFSETNPNFDLYKNSGFLSDSYAQAKLRFAPGGTFTAFDIAAKPVGRIDHIFITNDFSVNRYGILTNTYNGRFPSDHFAVFAELTYPE
jgi:endonuclease/exonuclease/phosphatase family metal-dependent hydrolase